jgi:hypothetical protein
MGKVKFDTANPFIFIEDVLLLTWFGGEDKVFDYTFVPAKNKETKIIVITGQNASGKSFVRRIFSSAMAQCKMEVMALSQEKRTGADYTDPVARSFIFGDERTQATGVNSARTVTTGIRTCRGRENPHCIIWDEPDLGLSDEYATDLGHLIADFAKENTKTFLIPVISHRRELLEPIAQGDHHYLHIGTENPKSLTEWLNRPIVRKSVEDLYTESHTRFLQIAKQLKG